MRRGFDGYSELIGRARVLGTYAQLHRFGGWELLRGLKVSRIIGTYGKSDGGWLWKVLESVAGQQDRKELDVIAPAVFILDLTYRIGEDRSGQAFRLCNSQFLSNCRLCIRERHGWWSLKRYSLMRKAREIYGKLEAGGNAAWQNRGAETVE